MLAINQFTGELSLAINTPEGVVLIVGCSHLCIDRIVQAATAINPRVHLVADIRTSQIAILARLAARPVQ